MTHKEAMDTDHFLTLVRAGISAVLCFGFVYLFAWLGGETVPMWGIAVTGLLYAFFDQILEIRGEVFGKEPPQQ